MTASLGRTAGAFAPQPVHSHCPNLRPVPTQVGIDCAHGAGNVPLSLHADGVDFGAWCGYKYVNAGPGGMAGIFVHAKYAAETMAERPFFAGWWGHKR